LINETPEAFPMIGQSTSPAPLGADSRAMNNVVSGETHDPHAVLGAHPNGVSTIIRRMRFI
jgi:1,4-alpha-glucan branching enzyme